MEQWTTVLAQISAQDLKIDPEVVGDNKQHLYVQALLGDKLLGSAAAMALVNNVTAMYQQTTQQSDKMDNADNYSTTNITAPLLPPSVVIDTGSLTKRISYAVSNAFLARHVDQILPGYTIDRSSEWEIGTAVEAAVCAVHRVEPDAVLELAQFLVHRAAATSTERTNTKGTFLEMGGRFVQSRRVGGKDHIPIFEATAVWENLSFTARGSSKKHAETEASRQVLERVDELLGVNMDEENKFSTLGLKVANVTMTLPSPSPSNESNSNSDTVYGQWQRFGNLDDVNIEDNETALDWWLRGACAPRKAFHRAMMASRVFPEHIVAVDSWVRRPEDDEKIDAKQQHATAIFAMVMDAQQRYHYISVETAVSATQARAIMGVRINQKIAELVGVELSSNAEKESDLEELVRFLAGDSKS